MRRTSLSSLLSIFSLVCLLDHTRFPHKVAVNSLPDTVVKAESVNSFKGRLDRFWNDQEVKYNWKAADIKGTGSRIV